MIVVVTGNDQRYNEWLWIAIGRTFHSLFPGRYLRSCLARSLIQETNKRYYRPVKRRSYLHGARDRILNTRLTSVSLVHWRCRKSTPEVHNPSQTFRNHNSNPAKPLNWWNKPRVHTFSNMQIYDHRSAKRRRTCRPWQERHGALHKPWEPSRSCFVLPLG